MKLQLSQLDAFFTEYETVTVGGYIVGMILILYFLSTNSTLCCANLQLSDHVIDNPILVERAHCSSVYCYRRPFRSAGTSRGVVPLRHLRHLSPPDSIATLVNSLQNRVNSITPSITLNANSGKIVLVTLCIQIEWLFYNALWCETVPRKWRRLHRARGHVSHFTNDWARGHRE